MINEPAAEQPRQTDVLLRATKQWPEEWQLAVNAAFTANRHLVEIDRYLDEWYGVPDGGG